MILPDLNLLIYAYNSDAPHHEPAKAWWEAALSTERPVLLGWAVILGFIRLMTHRSVLVRPLETSLAVAHVRSWLERPNVEIVDPGPRHLEILAGLLHSAGAAGSLTTDAHLAALAVEQRAELCSNDADFARFPGLRLLNPLC
jgi:uncharacterized protein